MSAGPKPRPGSTCPYCGGAWIVTPTKYVFRCSNDKCIAVTLPGRAEVVTHPTDEEKSHG